MPLPLKSITQPLSMQAARCGSMIPWPERIANCPVEQWVQVRSWLSHLMLDLWLWPAKTVKSTRGSSISGRQTRASLCRNCIIPGRSALSILQKGSSSWRLQMALFRCGKNPHLDIFFPAHSSVDIVRKIAMLNSVVVPVYNEEETVAQVLESLSRVPLNLEVVVVDDASTDRTWDILQELRQRKPFNAYRYVRHTRNCGKGAGLRTGFGLVSGDLVTIQDADMEYNPRDLPAPVCRWQDAGDTRVVVYGVRDLTPQKFTTPWGNRFLTMVTNILYGCRIHDMETCYKLIPGVLAHALPMEGRRFEIEPEITACIVQAGYTILEVPISYTPRKAKKLSPWRDGWPALAILLRRRFGKPFQYVAPTTESAPEKQTIP